MFIPSHWCHEGQYYRCRPVTQDEYKKLRRGYTKCKFCGKRMPLLSSNPLQKGE